MAEIWITSDTHFGHKNVLEFCPKTRPWSTIEEMDAAITDTWNTTIGKHDTVYHLGDFSFHKRERTEELLKQLSGQKYLVYGNHCSALRGAWAGKYFTHRVDILEHAIGGHKVVMSHFPMLSWNRSHYGSLHAYGHEHGADIGARGRAVDVGWDAQGKILHIDEFIKLAVAKEPQAHHGKTFKGEY